MCCQTYSQDFVTKTICCNCACGVVGLACSRPAGTVQPFQQHVHDCLTAHYMSLEICVSWTVHTTSMDMLGAGSTFSSPWEAWDWESRTAAENWGKGKASHYCWTIDVSGVQTGKVMSPPESWLFRLMVFACDSLSKLWLWIYKVSSTHGSMTVRINSSILCMSAVCSCMPKHHQCTG